MHYDKANLSDAIAKLEDALDPLVPHGFDYDSISPLLFQDVKTGMIHTNNDPDNCSGARWRVTINTTPSGNLAEIRLTLDELKELDVQGKTCHECMSFLSFTVIDSKGKVRTLNQSTLLEGLTA